MFQGSHIQGRDCHCQGVAIQERIEPRVRKCAAEPPRCTSKGTLALPVPLPNVVLTQREKRHLKQQPPDKPSDPHQNVALAAARAAFVRCQREIRQPLPQQGPPG